MYTTYGIVDPTTRLFVYVGQSVDFPRRKAEHLKKSRTRRTRHPKGSIKAWLADAEACGVVPDFVVLEVVETEEQSLLSESNWVEKLAAIDHPLRNRWEEHRDLIEAGAPVEIAEYHAFWPGKWDCSVAVMVPTLKGAGFSLTFPEKTVIKEGGLLVLMPKKKQGSTVRAPSHRISYD